MTLSGGVTAVAVKTPSVGVLLRQSVACFLGVRLDAVALIGVTQTNASLPAVVLDVPSDDPVNLATVPVGSLSYGTNGSGTRALLGVRPSVSPHLRTLRAGGGDSSGAIVSLTVQCLACAPAPGAAPQFAPALVTQLAAFNRSVAAGGPAFAPFVVAVAGASGVNATAVYAQGSVTGSTAATSSAVSLETSTALVAIAVGVSVAVVLLVLVGLLVFLGVMWRHRRSSAHKSDDVAASSGMVAEQGVFSGENPLRRGARDGKVIVPAVEPVTAMPVSQSTGSGMDSSLTARNS